MVFNVTFNNISVIWWRSVLLLEKTGENYRPATSHWQALSHNVVSSTPRLSGFVRTTSVVIGTDCIGSCKSNRHMITTNWIPMEIIGNKTACPAPTYLIWEVLIVQLSFSEQFINTIRNNYLVQKLYHNYHNFSKKSTVSKRHYTPLHNMVNYTSWPIIVSYVIAIGPIISEELHSQCITILKMHENIKVP